MVGHMRNRIIYGVYLTALLAYSLAGFRVYRLTAADKDDERYEQMELFARVLERVRRDYVDGDKLTYKDLVQGALRGMLNTLDPHSEFLDLTKFQELKEDTEGAYGGVGLQVGVRDGLLTVIAPMEDSPAFTAGILPGDKILQIDGKLTEKLSQGDAVKRLRGDPGSKVTLTIGRGTLPAPKDFELTREDIRISTAKDINNRREFPIDDDHLGYVRLTQFGDHTADELEDALVKLEKKGMRALVLDLRGNPGGLLDQAVAVCEKFLERGKPIVSTEARSPANEIHKKAAGRGKIRSVPLVVLVDGGSASASEIVAGCLQDLKRAVIVGEQTFGKGSVQSILPFQDGSALRLTTAKYYTPSHRVIHERGITPDIVVSLNEDEEVAVRLRRMPGAATNIEETIKIFDPEHRTAIQDLVALGRDAQLERANDLLKAMDVLAKRDPAHDSKEIRPLAR